MFEGANRSYLIYAPASLPANTQVPVVLALHGFTQTAEHIMAYSGFNTIADNEGFIVVYPNGTNLSWNVGFTSNGANDVGFLSTLIDSLKVKYPVDLDRIYACGMSNGGFMSYQLACSLSNRIAAIASVSGSMTNTTFETCHPGRPMPVLEIHGTADLIVNYGGATGIRPVIEVIKYWAEQNHCPEIPQTQLLPDLMNEGSRVERSVYTPCAPNSEVMFMKILQGGHTWPGSTNSGIGNTNRDILASQEIWEFFRRFSLSGVSTGTKNSDASLSVRIFPNPASEFLQVELPKERLLHGATLRLFDSQGRPALQQAISGATTEIFVGALPAGLYFMEIHTKDGLARKRVVIQ